MVITWRCQRYNVSSILTIRSSLKRVYMIKKKWNSLTHHSGKPRLGPMSTEKLEEMLKTCRPRHKNKITNELAKRSK